MRLCAADVWDSDAFRVYLPLRGPVFLDKTRCFGTFGHLWGQSVFNTCGCAESSVISYLPVTHSSVGARVSTDVFCWWEKEAWSKKEVVIRRCTLGCVCRNGSESPDSSPKRSESSGSGIWPSGVVSRQMHVRSCLIVHVLQFNMWMLHLGKYRGFE